MESIIFAGAVFCMMWLCYIVFKSDKNKEADDDLGFFSYKANKDMPSKAGSKK